MLDKKRNAKARRGIVSLLSAVLVLQMGMPVPYALARPAADASLSSVPTAVGDDVAPQDAVLPQDGAASTDVATWPETFEPTADRAPADDSGAALDDNVVGAPASDAMAPKADSNTAPDAEKGPASDAQQPDMQQPDAPKPGIESANDDRAIQPVDEAAPAALEVQTSNTGTKTSGDLTVEELDDGGALLIPYYSGGSASVGVTARIPQDDPGGIIYVESSDPSVVSVQEYYDELDMSYCSAHMAYFNGGSFGAATITMTYVASSGETSVVSFEAVHCPGEVQDVTVAKASNSKVKLSWTAVAGVTGYRIYAEAYDYDAEDWKTRLAKTVTGESTSSAVVAAPWGLECYFSVRPYIEVSGDKYGVDDTTDPYAAYDCYFKLDYPANRKPTIAKADYNKIKLSWKTISGVTGYKVYRCPVDEYGWATGAYKVVKSVKGAQTADVTIGAAWDKGYSYVISPYLELDGTTYVNLDESKAAAFTLAAPSVKVASITKAAAKKLKVTWSADKGVTSFKLYRSAKENSGYKLIATLGADVTSHTSSATPGTIYYYKVVAIYGTTGEATSSSFAQHIPVIGAADAASKAKTAAVSSLGSWYNARDVYAYAQGSTTYVASLQGRTLVVQGFDKKLKLVSTKKVTLDAYDLWGGLYHGPDNNNYVITGSPNPKESKKKVVIQVTKYSSSWEKGKTATIKGGGSNVYEGIYVPFAASSVALDMQGTTLYMMTGRRMFRTEDGLNHQSNIGFKINTTTMKATVSNISYASHSFGQLVRFKDGTLYVADHGDAFPRSMQLTWQKGYGTKSAGDARSFDAFEIIGATGDNYTGASLGGMEVGKNNVLMCGTSVPQNYSIKGITGNSTSFKHNMYVTVTNRATGKTTVRWLTSYKPTGKVGVLWTSMVKLSEERFGILYIVYDGSSYVPYYMVIDGNGKKVFNRKIYGATVNGATNAVFAGGRVLWVSPDASYKGRICSIQAL